MTTTTMDPFPRAASGAGPGRGALAVLAVLGALAPAALLVAITRTALPLAALPAVTFGVPVMTAPALYVTLILAGGAPPMVEVAAALGRGLLGLALAQLGLAVPLAFLATTATPETAMAIVAAGTMVAAVVAARALDLALGAPVVATFWRRDLVLWGWLALTAVIAARLYAEVLAGVAP